MDEHVRYAPSRIHDQFMWLDRPHKISKEAIHTVTRLCATGEVPLLRYVPKNDVEKLTRSKWDGRAMTVNNISDPTVKYASMVIGYRIYYSSKMNNVLVAAIHTAYQMIIEDVDYDLSEALRSQLMLNLEAIKKDKRLRFKFGQLILGLFFYFQNSFPGIGDIKWIGGTPTLMQMKNSIRMLGNDFDKIAWGYFKDFQKKMHARERIVTEVVNWYEKTIYFMVDTDTCMMEVVEPQFTWVMPMGYEVDKEVLVTYADHLLGQPVDSTTKCFGTYKEKSLQVHSELNQSVIAKKIRKEVEAFGEQAGFRKESIVEARGKHIAQQAGASSTPTDTSTGMQTRAGKGKVVEKEKPTTIKKEKPTTKYSNIQFQKRGKVVDPSTEPVKTGKRKKQQAQKPTLIDADD